MKRFLVVGLGNFGSTLAQRLFEMGHDVVAIDQRPDIVDGMSSRVTRGVVGDATRPAVLEEAGARNADAAVIATGESLASSILALIALKDMHVSEIFVKVGSHEHERVANALGATDSIFPERESALGLAARITAGQLLQYVQLAPHFGLQEMPVPKAWWGRTLRELALPHRYRVQVVAVHDVLQDVMMSVPDPDRKLVQSDTLLVAGEATALQRLADLR
ncbi:MAG: TrkA family potassium uptake protein [Myxococcota bacterium]